MEVRVGEGFRVMYRRKGDRGNPKLVVKESLYVLLVKEWCEEVNEVGFVGGMGEGSALQKTLGAGAPNSQIRFTVDLLMRTAVLMTITKKPLFLL